MKFTCTGCRKSKPASEFHIDRKAKTGYKSVCKSCTSRRRSQTRSAAVTDRQLRAAARVSALKRLAFLHEEEYRRLCYEEYSRAKISPQWVGLTDGMDAVV